MMHLTYYFIQPNNFIELPSSSASSSSLSWGNKDEKDYLPVSEILYKYRKKMLLLTQPFNSYTVITREMAIINMRLKVLDKIMWIRNTTKISPPPSPSPPLN